MKNRGLLLAKRVMMEQDNQCDEEFCDGFILVASVQLRYISEQEVSDEKSGIGGFDDFIRLPNGIGARTRGFDSRYTANPRQVDAPARININRASLQDLQRIAHIGEARARQIMALRPFRTMDDLTQVRGIGAARLADIKQEGLAYVE